MNTPATLLTKTAIALALLYFSGDSSALTCEELRTSIEAKIQDKGVTRFSVLITEVGTPVVGQVVGTCERGAKKLVYAQGNGPVLASAAVASQAKPSTAAPPRVVTECADGRVITEGSCKR